MALIRWQATVQDEAGNAVFNPSITVRNASNNSLASIFDDAEVAKLNPFIGGLDGFVSFKAAPGRYIIQGASGTENAPDWIVDLAEVSFEFDTIADLVADTTLDYPALVAGDIVKIKLGKTQYEVAASGASDHHITTASGLKLYEAGIVFSTRSRASQAVARGVFTAGDVVYVGSRRFTVDVNAIDDLVAVDFDFRGKFEEYAAKMQQGDTVRIAAIGDSTTDGNGTTGWTNNPVDGSGNAIGSGAHTPSAAWPATMQVAIRQMFNNNNIFVWNAGYGGTAIVTDWAITNYTTAVINNPAYGIPDVVFINYGLNDANNGAFSVENFDTKMTELLSHIEYYGSTPVFVTPDAVMQDTPRQGGNLSMLISVMREMADRCGITILDAHEMQLKAYNLATRNARWSLDQPDFLHGNDQWHSRKGAWIAAKVFPNTLWVDHGEEVVSVAPWAKHSSTNGLTYNEFDSVNNHFGASANIVGNTYTLGQFLIEMWVWTDSAERDLYWHSVDGDGYYNPRPLADVPKISVYSYSEASLLTVSSATAGQASGVAGRRASEDPVYINKLSSGLSRVRFVAPTDIVTEAVYLGYFSIRKRDLPLSVSRIIPSGGSGQVYWDMDQFGAAGTLASFGNGRTMDMFISVSIPQGAGIHLWSGRVFGGSASSSTNDQSGVLLFRGSNLAIWRTTFKNDGTGSLVASMASAAYTWTDVNRFRIRALVTGSGQQEIYVYSGFETTSALITIQIPRGNETLPFGGHVGGVFMNYGAAGAQPGAAVMTVHGINVT